MQLFAQSALKVDYNGKNIYFDPFKINNNFHDADYIFITHSHYDHFSKEDILKIKKDNTKIIIPNDLYKEVISIFDDTNIKNVEPDSEYIIDDIKFKTTYAYNINKKFHQKEFGWVGYILYLDNILYVAGDTDNIKEINNIKCDIACVPIGGTYTMNYMEAADLIRSIKPKVAIPIHYKTVVGSELDALNFKNELENECEVKIFEF